MLYQLVLFELPSTVLKHSAFKTSSLNIQTLKNLEHRENKSFIKLLGFPLQEKGRVGQREACHVVSVEGNELLNSSSLL